MSTSLPPFRQVVAAHVPDPRHIIIQDFTLSCGHRLAARTLKRGADGHYHRPTRLRCPICQRLGTHTTQTRPAHQGLRSSTLQTVTPSSATTAPVQPETHPFDLAPVSTGSQDSHADPAWSPRDLASRNWD